MIFSSFSAVRSVVAIASKLLLWVKFVICRRSFNGVLTIVRIFSAISSTVFSNDSAPGLSVLEVIAPDRPGLLTIIGQVFFRHKLRLHNAKISTLGERVEDVFFITDRNDQMIVDADLIAKIEADLKTELDEHRQQ